LEGQGYEVVYEHPVQGNGAIDILATRPGERVAVEVETVESDVQGNIDKIRHAGFDRIILLATSPSVVGICQKVMDSGEKTAPPVELLTWLDIS
jgi:predicted RecB family endonuclease